MEDFSGTGEFSYGGKMGEINLRFDNSQASLILLSGGWRNCDVIHQKVRCLIIRDEFSKLGVEAETRNFGFITV